MNNKKNNLLVDNYFELSADSIKKCSKFKNKIDKIVNKIIKIKKLNKKILVAGNGGSAADAEHFVGELACTFKDKNRPSYPAYSLNSIAAITAWANDFTYETYLTRQIKAISNSGDLLFLLSSSGGNLKTKQSINLINAIKEAKKSKLFTVTLTGKSGGYLKKNSDININIESNETSIIQECHMSILHYICQILENEN